MRLRQPDCDEEFDAEIRELFPRADDLDLLRRMRSALEGAQSDRDPEHSDFAE